nr:immunoglobulin heavy chain junction region [Mus musculus]MBK4196386.1 immunoglobulin heavy chain junction region [Mus musculus]
CARHYYGSSYGLYYYAMDYW